jgi:type III restriction enzyme
LKQKFKLNHSKQFQLDAIESTIKLFEGQRKLDTSFVDYIDGVSSNKLDLEEKEILENLNEIQKTNQIPISNQLDGMNFSIEMETGTGKTYVYMRTIYELNKQYGFEKFIIVVPSVAIREGTKKNFEIVKDDFEILYNKIPIRCSEYQSKNLTYVKDFCKSNKIELMIITIDSFNKDGNILNTPQPERGFYGKKPIELIQKTNPIVILDEPQNMEKEKSSAAIASMHPLCTLRYSATHKYPYNLIYQLSPVDAINQKLVKRIQVYSVFEDIDANKPSIVCESVTKKGNKFKAKIKVAKNSGGKIKLTSISVKVDDDLEKLTNIRQYHGYVVEELFVDKYIKFRNREKILVGDEIGTDQKEIQRIQINRAIRSHFEIQQELRDKKIKVLSLFFIDKVSNYVGGGILQKFFDDEFNKLKKEYPDFEKLDPQNVRDGYFSQKKTDSEKTIQKDSEAFEKIMKDKERLLSFDEPTSFIFSHSALREGWDNPNVFVICTLNQSFSNMRKRQEIGRGLRLPVTTPDLIQQTDDEYTLTVVANLNYETYVETLQNEYNEDYGSGASPPIENARKQVWVSLDKTKFESKEFEKLWDKISPTANYSAQINSDELVKQCIKEIEKDLKVDSIVIRSQLASVNMTKQNDSIKITSDPILTGSDTIDHNYVIGNIVDEFTERLGLTRKTVIKILTGIKNLNLIFNDPQKFVISTSEIIKKILHSYIVDGIEYNLDGKKLPKYEVFKDTIKSYEYKTTDAINSIYDKVIFDSDFEKQVSERLSSQSRIKLYIKLPSKFIISTPVGNYNPDWAIVSEKQDLKGKLQEILHFVVETKAKDVSDRGTNEQFKIECGKKHFEILEIPYEVVENLSDLERMLNNA